VRVAAKAVDDGLVAQLEIQVFLYAQLRKQRLGLRMHLRGLAVNVGHVGKHALRGGQAADLPTGHHSCASTSASCAKARGVSR
jgi:hypothetical protein